MSSITIDDMPLSDAEMRSILGKNVNYKDTAPFSVAADAYLADARKLGIADIAGDTKGIGDVTSDAKGSGARYNNGKPDLSLIPLTMVAGFFMDEEKPSLATGALEQLGLFQATHDTKYLFRVLEILGADGWEECAHVFTYGKRKYAAWNWAKGMPWSVPVACAARHLLAMIACEHLDRESQLPHRGHVFCNVVMLLQYTKTFAEGNDLPPVGLL